MNSYLLPKNTNQIKINYIFSNNIKPFVSHSLIYFLNILYKQLQDTNMMDQIEIITKHVNTYEFICSNVPDSSLSVSKINTYSNVFYELVEIFNTCNISEELFEKNKLTNMHISENSSASSVLLFSLLRENKTDINLSTHFNIPLLLNKSTFPSKINFFFFELNKSHYISTSIYFKYALVMLYVILKNQAFHGVSILKIEGIIYKPILDILYILTCFFDKVHIVKPVVSNIFSHERYIVCNKFINNNSINHNNNKVELLKKLEEIIHAYYSISSIIENPLPYYFINKIEESNIVIGHQQLEALDQTILIMKNKNKEDKMESLKKNHIQKSIQWCEKYKVPHNKFIDKTNIFLNATNNVAKETEVNNEIQNQVKEIDGK